MNDADPAALPAAATDLFDGLHAASLLAALGEHTVRAAGGSTYRHNVVLWRRGALWQLEEYPATAGIVCRRGTREVPARLVEELLAAGQLVLGMALSSGQPALTPAEGRAAKRRQRRLRETYGPRVVSP